MPAPLRDSIEEDDTDDGVICAFCNNKVPDDVRNELIFWMDCDKCDKWVHNK